MSRNIKRMLSTSIRTLFEETKTMFSEIEFCILYASLFGDTPLTEESKLLFQEQNEVNIEKMEQFLKAKFDQFNETDLHVLEIFRIIDKDTKCYITAEDIMNAYKEKKIPFSIEQLIECFNLVASEENILDYFSFRKLYREIM